MTTRQFYTELEKILESPPGSLSGNEELSSLNGWDSMAGVALIALFDLEFGMAVSGRGLRACKTAEDILKLAGDKIR